jgi:RimJ/RimL family protein N-acetyltransferase
MFERVFPITTARLRIALLVAADAPDVRALTDDPAIVISFLPRPFGLEDAKTLVAGLDQGRHRFAAFRSGATLIGVLGMFFHDAKNVELGYWVGTAHQGASYASEALAGTVAALRTKLPDVAIFAECRDSNLASRRVLEKAGFRPTGQAGQRADMQRYQLTAAARAP